MLKPSTDATCLRWSAVSTDRWICFWTFVSTCSTCLKHIDITMQHMWSVQKKCRLMSFAFLGRLHCSAMKWLSAYRIHRRCQWRCKIFGGGAIVHTRKQCRDFPICAAPSLLSCPHARSFGCLVRSFECLTGVPWWHQAQSKHKSKWLKNYDGKCLHAHQSLKFYDADRSSGILRPRALGRPKNLR